MIVYLNNDINTEDLRFFSASARKYLRMIEMKRGLVVLALCASAVLLGEITELLSPGPTDHAWQAAVVATHQ
ncbi:hypothetical protein A3843_03895 [Pseudovibrio exalbescens]|uniref:Uncharacterized protein n=1 Tax=Pseudovibrio exalbescens TaxID=197461 RepID=A0A1U7JL68_9HYPH|nr:hypothetical protein A3843_03895 [Pseudovibrio exalbescens]